MNTMVSVNQLKKSFDEKAVVKEISFEVEKGEILCLLGPNGAGKSTTINVLCGILGYDGGEMYYRGKNIKTCLNAFKRNLGVVPQDLAIYEDLSAQQNVRFFASLYGLKGNELDEKVNKALEFVGLLERSKDKAKTFSGGMKRRLNIACAIAHEPELLIMDEPTVGIDPQSRNHILSSIKKLSQHGMTILYTTHYMEEVEEISTRILIMDSGTIIAEGTKESLKEDIFDERQFIMEIEEDDHLNVDEFYKIEGIKKVEKQAQILTITTLKNIENLDKIIALVITSKSKILNLFCRTASLENVFLRLTGKSLRD
ncbi:ABC transporter ATP-binding protein [Acetobacterium woodii]|uniref:ABC transport system ATP-binding protein n=1 Tax=Acetobacterium woodii (strain ATCC 29683 / DSM 1030 / JCM 2381 / KCTC 1655 / WB1) TaxID=931626 RepID=H6LJJ5_ACEWD|nr:ABC transporter ATP-binding protein [Acetobacterium woodii]AFA49923.1 ABC transport system ATP-binding protein [Acetobacterium woodii DSM 1030]